MYKITKYYDTVNEFILNIFDKKTALKIQSGFYETFKLIFNFSLF